MYLYIDMYNILTFLICGIIYVIMFSISMWFLGMNQYEKDLIGKPVARIIRKINFSNK